MPILKNINISLLFLLMIGWLLVFLLNGQPQIYIGWAILLLSLLSIITILILIIILSIRLVKHKKIDKWFLTMFMILILYSIPIGWFAGASNLTFPANIDETEPALYIDCPLNQTTIVGWGGKTIKENYHVQVPGQRWAYDLLMEPAGIGTTNLEDYGIYNKPVFSPVNGTVVSVLNTDIDILPHAELDNNSSSSGNHVYIRVDETGTYIVLNHLKQGSVVVNKGDYVVVGDYLGRVGNSGSTSEPHLHIHHQRQNPAEVSVFFSEGLPLYFENIDGPSFPKGGVRVEENKDIPIGDEITPLNQFQIQATAK